jgi:hypothetical protein
VLVLVCIRICYHRVTKSVGLTTLPAIRVPVQVWYCAPGHVHTGEVCVGDTFSPMSRAHSPAIKNVLTRDVVVGNSDRFPSER